MDAETKRRLAVVLGVLGEVFQVKITPTIIRGYEWGLDGISAEAIEQAAGAAMRQNRAFIPKPGELRELTGDRQLSPEARAGMALDVAVRAIAIHGEYQSVWFDDPFTTATIRRLGGWPAFCDRFTAATEWDRKEWRETYRDILSSGCDSSQALPLCGYHETTNQLTGYADAQPRPYRIACGLPDGGKRPALTNPATSSHSGLPRLAGDTGRPNDAGRIVHDTADALRPAICDDRADALA